MFKLALATILAAYSTFPDRVAARKAVSFLVKKRLVACANIFPVESKYIWEGKIVKEKEFAVIFKTLPSKEAKVFAALKKSHPYELACICSWKEKTTNEYYAWVKESVLL